MAEQSAPRRAVRMKIESDDSRPSTTAAKPVPLVVESSASAEESAEQSVSASRPKVTIASTPQNEQEAKSSGGAPVVAVSQPVESTESPSSAKPVPNTTVARPVTRIDKPVVEQRPQDSDDVAPAANVPVDGGSTAGSSKGKAATGSSTTPDASVAPETDGRATRTRISATEWVRRTFPGHEHAAWGGIVALLVAMLVFVIGLWRVLFIGIVVFIGVAVGQVLDGDPKLVNAIRNLFESERGQR